MNTPVPSPISQSITEMTDLHILSQNSGPTYRDLDTKFPPAKDLSAPDQLSPSLADFGSEASPIIESPTLLDTSVSQPTHDNDNIPLDTPYPVQVPQHKAIQNLLREHGIASPPLTSPPSNEEFEPVSPMVAADSVDPTKLDPPMNLGTPAATDYVTSG